MKPTRQNSSCDCAASFAPRGRHEQPPRPMPAAALNWVGRSARVSRNGAWWSSWLARSTVGSGCAARRRGCAPWHTRRSRAWAASRDGVVRAMAAVRAACQWLVGVHQATRTARRAAARGHAWPTSSAGRPHHQRRHWPQAASGPPLAAGQRRVAATRSRSGARASRPTSRVQAAERLPPQALRGDAPRSAPLRGACCTSS